jgi:hypothetical protein
MMRFWSSRNYGCLVGPSFAFFLSDPEKSLSPRIVRIVPTGRRRNIRSGFRMKAYAMMRTPHRNTGTPAILDGGI